MAAQTAELHLCWWLPKFSTCKTSKRTTSALAAGTGLALAAVGSLGMYMCRLGQTRVWAASIAPIVGPGSWWLKSWYLTSVDLPQWPCENNVWESLGPIASIPTVKMGPRAVPTSVYFASPHNGQKRTHQSTYTGEHLQRRNTQWLLSQWECSNTTYLTPQIRNRA